MPEQVIKANADNVKAITQFLITNGVDAWVKEHPDTQAIDLFMAGHSIHKYIVSQIAVTWSRNGIPPDKTIRMADQTFRKAMRELWRGS